MQSEFKEIPTNFQSVTPFKMYKTWSFITSSYSFALDNDNISILDAPAYSNIDAYIDENNFVQTGSFWYSIKAMFYGSATNAPSGTTTSTIYSSYMAPYYNDFTEHNLGTGSAIVISIPQEKYGDAIQEKTLKFTCLSGSNNIPYSASGGNTATTMFITDDGHGNLYDILNTSYSSSIGNISYKKGLIIITDQNYYSYVSKSLFTGFMNTISTLNFTSYYTAQQSEYMCVVKSYEMNNTNNPTAYVKDIAGNQKFKFENITDTNGNTIEFRPLCTGISLHDSTGQAVVVAKFAKPVKIENDIDSIFIIRYDT